MVLRNRGEGGQATVEWTALLLLVSLAVVAAAGAAAGAGMPGAELARALASRVICAARLAGSCEKGSAALAAEYGAEVAALVREQAPTVHYRSGARYLPVDHRECRETGCASVSGEGAAWRTDDGLSATAFTRVVDCRPSGAERAEADGATCSGRRAGSLYIQY